MRFKLILFLVNNVKIEILESDQLMDIDILTTQYKDDTDLIKASSNIINNYFGKIVDINAFLGMVSDRSLKVCFFDQGGYYKEVSPLYKDNKRKLNPTSMLNDIVKFLKDDMDYTVTVRFLDKFMYMFNSQFNIKRNNIYGLKKILSVNSTDSSSLSMQQKSFDKILKIIRDDLQIRSSDIAEKQIRYVNLRVIYEYINMYPSSSVKRTISTSNNKTCSTEDLFNIFIDELLKEEGSSYTTMGEVAYLFDEYLSACSEKVRVKK